ncbi:cAMP-specific 3',5'-cyclic phosphodiesterase 4D [Bagarius yarrelli]|uniref:cAMP-specific 3',5'-cyclic phosphodiesterase 4D n=1 Tax=Bagarius yarrelli TaxID=175774 RepID=A0A556U385_BAGYA|nr:cAMP-specific 3',5'-cyclic phosphodiesterase 4D [Bagarius yarrelli]
MQDNPVQERLQVRRRSSRTLQLPPLAFRQAEQLDWKESEQPSRPNTLALSMPPLIAITLADSNRLNGDTNYLPGRSGYNNSKHKSRQLLAVI